MRQRKAMRDRRRGREGERVRPLMSYLVLCACHLHTYTDKQTQSHTLADRQRASKAKNVFITYATCCLELGLKCVRWAQNEAQTKCTICSRLAWVYPVVERLNGYTQLEVYFHIFRNNINSIDESEKCLIFLLCFADYRVFASRATSCIHSKFACFAA